MVFVFARVLHKFPNLSDLSSIGRELLIIIMPPRVYIDSVVKFYVTLDGSEAQSIRLSSVRPVQEPRGGKPEFFHLADDVSFGQFPPIGHIVSHPAAHPVREYLIDDSNRDVIPLEVDASVIEGPVFFGIVACEEFGIRIDPFRCEMVS